MKDVLDVINTIRFERESDIFTITKFYEDLLMRMGNENRSAGEFHTPRTVTRFMVDVIDPQIGETIYDPATGSAGFLAQTFQYMQPKAQTVEGHIFLQQHAFHGTEKKGLSFLLGTMDMVLHGVVSPNIQRGNTLEEDVKQGGGKRYDVILTNPPFGGTEGRHIQQNFAVQANATELLFMQHLIKKLKKTPNARCAVVVPEGTLFHGGAFAQVKKDLLDPFHLYAVVSSPPGTFAPYSDVKAALLFFQRPDNVQVNNPLARDEVWFYEMGLPTKLKRFSKGNPIGDVDFDEAREQWQQWRDYLCGEIQRPFGFSETLREHWQTWEQPEETAWPKPPYTTWVEEIDALKGREYNLSTRNPNQDERVKLPRPAEITASLLERTREFQSTLLNLHEMLGNKEGCG